MAVSSIDVVLQFLRKNGLTDSESSLLEDIREKSNLGSSDLYSTVVSTPPALKSQTGRRKSPVTEEKGSAESGSDDNDSSDEFVSLASSTTDLCSSGIFLIFYQLLVYE